MPTTNYYWDVDTDNVFLEEDENGNTIAEYTQEPSLYGELIARARALTGARTDTEAIQRALQKTVADAEIERALDALLRDGRFRKIHT